MFLYNLPPTDNHKTREHLINNGGGRRAKAWWMEDRWKYLAFTGYAPEDSWLRQLLIARGNSPWHRLIELIPNSCYGLLKGKTNCFYSELWREMKLEHKSPVDRDAFKHRSFLMNRNQFSATVRQTFVGGAKPVVSTSWWLRWIPNWFLP